MKWLKTETSSIEFKLQPYLKFAKKIASVLDSIEIEQYDIGLNFFESFTDDCLSLVTKREAPGKKEVKEFAWEYRRYPEHYLESTNSDGYNSLHDNHARTFFLVYWLTFCYVRC